MTKQIDLGFEETKASLRNSQIFLDDMSYDSKSLPKQDASSGDDLPELSNKKYPYLSTSTYSLPRNHRYLFNTTLDLPKPIKET